MLQLGGYTRASSEEAQNGDGGPILVLSMSLRAKLVVYGIPDEKPDCHRRMMPAASPMRPQGCTMRGTCGDRATLRLAARRRGQNGGFAALPKQVAARRDSHASRKIFPFEVESAGGAALASWQQLRDAASASSPLPEISK